MEGYISTLVNPLHLKQMETSKTYGILEIVGRNPQEIGLTGMEKARIVELLPADFELSLTSLSYNELTALGFNDTEIMALKNSQEPEQAEFFGRQHLYPTGTDGIAFEQGYSDKSRE